MIIMAPFFLIDFRFNVSPARIACCEGALGVDGQCLLAWKLQNHLPCSGYRSPDKDPVGRESFPAFCRQGIAVLR